MTKDRALQVLHVYASVNGSGQCTQDEYEEAKKMAIKALNAQPETHKKHTETHACDTISRQGALDGLSKLRPRMIDTYEKDGDTFLKVRACDVNDMLEGLPPAQPERDRGEWIIHETINDRYDDMICPFCRKSYTVDAYRIDDIGFTAEDFNFCPNCGADMRGEQDEQSKTQICCTNCN